jgi:hypothetical protein
MSLLEIKVEFSMLIDQVKRIADALERQNPVSLPSQSYPPEDVLLQDDEEIWKRETETAEDEKQGLPPKS